MKKVRATHGPFLAALTGAKKYPLNAEFSAIEDADAIEIERRWRGAVEVLPLDAEEAVDQEVAKSVEDAKVEEQEADDKGE